jgi:talin
MRRLEKASNAVRRATDELVKAAQGAIDRNEEETELLVNTTSGSVNIIAEEVEARESVYKMEKQLRDAQRRLAVVHGKKYKGRGTDSETDQSGYESSGYEYTSSPQTYTSYRQVYTSPPQINTHSSSHHTSQFHTSQSYDSPEAAGSTDNTIESGPSFSESLNRFKTASGHNAQVASWKSSRQSSSHVQRRVEETRTMITQSSQKSYHIE